MSVNHIRLILPPVDPKLHSHNKGHWRNKSKAVKGLRELACALTRKATRRKWQIASVSYYFYFGDLRRRDAANAIQATKPAIDGIVDAGLIPDDDWQHLRIISVHCGLDRENPRVELVLWEES